MLLKGQKVKDQISGFEGLVTETKRYPNGTVHHLIRSGVGKLTKDLWFGENQLELLGKPIEPAKTEIAPKTAPVQKSKTKS